MALTGTALAWGVRTRCAGEDQERITHPGTEQVAWKSGSPAAQFGLGGKVPLGGSLYSRPRALVREMNGEWDARLERQMRLRTADVPSLRAALAARSSHRTAVLIMAPAKMASGGG